MLNTQQQQAVHHNGAPLLIIAGAGTGKTTVITERIVHLIENEGKEPESILALTFTDKAANEMLERVDVQLPLGHSEATIKTFHGFCDQILRQYGLEIGIATGYRILTEVESWMFFKDRLFDFSFEYYRPMGNPTKFISAIVSYFKRLQDENVQPEEYQKYVTTLPESCEEETHEKKRHKELSNVYEQYIRCKLCAGLFEFSDLHYYVLKLFRERPNVLKRVREKYQHILVDEFQDTNLIQFELIKLLAEDGKELTVVADDDQSIYAFRGSNISNILTFTHTYPHASKITLNQNYRSPQVILDAAYSLIQHNNPERLEVKENIDKKLKACKENAAGEIDFKHFVQESEEVNFVADTIEAALKDESYRASDCAILVRAGNNADLFVQELNFRGIPYQFLGLRGLYERDEIKDLLAFLRFIRNQTDNQALFRLMRISGFGFEMDEILLLLNESRNRKVSLWMLLKKVHKNKASKMVTSLEEYVRKSRDFRGGALLYEFVKDLLYPQLLVETTLENEKKILNIHAFFERIKQFESGSQYQDCVHLIDFLDLVIEAGENPATAEGESDIDAVKIMTVHASKGLEFPLVFLPSLVSNRFPSVNRSETITFPDGLKKELMPDVHSNVAEERRLFYVACTRAKQKLYLTCSRYYGAGKRAFKVSPFVKEAGFVSELAEEKKSDRKNIFVRKDSTVQTGDSLFSHQFPIPKKFSYTQLSAFQDCPRKYQYTYIYRIPGEGSPALSFGSSMHNTLKRFYEYLKEKSVPRLFEHEEPKDSYAMLMQMYEGSFIYSDYLTREHQEQAFELGKNILNDFYKHNGPDFTLPFLIEKSFVLHLGDYVFSGRFDRIDKVSADAVEIIDYKTGSKKTQKDVDNDLQLSLYALACKDVLHFEPEKLSLYFLNDNTKVISVRTDVQLDKARSKLISLAKALTESDFEPTPNKYTCDKCPYKNICNAAIL